MKRVSWKLWSDVVLPYIRLFFAICMSSAIELLLSEDPLSSFPLPPFPPRVISWTWSHYRGVPGIWMYRWTKSGCEFCSSIYRCSNRNDAETWNKMVTIKSNILNLWDIAPIGVRICCIKFVQRVILVQSRGITDPRVCYSTEMRWLHRTRTDIVCV